MKKNLYILLFLFSFLIPVFSDNIRGEINEVLNVSTDKIESNFKIFDLTGVTISQNPFIEGLELTLTIPDDLLKFRDSFMLNIYYKLNSKPDTNVKSYTGNLLLSEVLPVSKKMFISIPITNKSNNDIIPGSIITKLLNYSDLPLLLSINPVMKGIPSTVLSSMFKIEVIPVLSNKGILELNINGADSNTSYKILIDGKEILLNTKFTLEEGIHQINIESDKFKEISSSFVISRGTVTKLNLTLEQIISTVEFEAPEGSVIILDGKKIVTFQGTSLKLDPGEHVVRMELDDYDLSKKFNVDLGKKYKISLFLDILIQEN